MKRLLAALAAGAIALSGCGGGNAAREAAEGAAKAAGKNADTPSPPRESESPWEKYHLNEAGDAAKEVGEEAGQHVGERCAEKAEKYEPCF